MIKKSKNRALTRIFENRIKNATFQKKLGVLPFNSIATFQKVGVRLQNSKFGVNETSEKRRPLVQPDLNVRHLFPN